MAKPKAKKKRKRVIEAAKDHRKTADRMFDRQILRPMQDVYEEEADAIVRSVRRTLRGKLRSEVSDRAVLDEVMRVFERRMRQASVRLVIEMEHTTRGTLAQSTEALADFVGKVKGTPTVLDDLVTRNKVIATHKKAIEEQRRKATAALSANIYTSTRTKLLERISDGATAGELVRMIGDELDEQWWQMQRFVRTETSAAFNQAQEAGIEALREEDPRILMRWTEHIDDLTGRPLDDRVAKDSIALHGQVAPPGGRFYMPAGASVPGSMVGASWTTPPNRPNDRAVLLPWSKSWGIPGWRYFGGKRVIL